MCVERFTSGGGGGVTEKVRFKHGLEGVRTAGFQGASGSSEEAAGRPEGPLLCSLSSKDHPWNPSGEFLLLSPQASGHIQRNSDISFTYKCRGHTSCSYQRLSPSLILSMEPLLASSHPTSVQPQYPSTCPHIRSRVCTNTANRTVTGLESQGQRRHARQVAEQKEMCLRPVRNLPWAQSHSLSRSGFMSLHVSFLNYD